MSYEAWIGREEESTQRVLSSVVAAMAATLDLERAPQPGEPLPPGWQWLFFNPLARRSAVIREGVGFCRPSISPVECGRAVAFAILPICPQGLAGQVALITGGAGGMGRGLSPPKRRRRRQH